MKRTEFVAFLGVVSLLLMLIAGCGGGGGGGNGGGGTGTAIIATITGAAFVAFQDGRTGAWQRLPSSGSGNYSFNVQAADGRYSVAWVCGGTKPQVNIVHLTTAEATAFAASCSSTSASTVTVSGTVQGLGSGQAALVSAGSASATVGANGGTFDLSLVPGPYDLIGIRLGTTGEPNKVWLRRSVSFSNNTSGLTIDFTQPDGTVVRVIDVSSGSLTVTGADSTEIVTTQLYFQSSRRSSLLAVGVPGMPMQYPVFPTGVLQTGENFRIVVTTDTGRGEVHGLNNLPSSLSITLPPLFASPSFDFATTGELTFTAQWGTYSASPVRAYEFTLSSDVQQRSWRIWISAGWLGGNNRYTTPVLNTLSGWNSSAWDLQRGSPVNASFQVLVSPNTVQQLLDYRRDNIAPEGFRLRFATRSVTLTP